MLIFNCPPRCYPLPGAMIEIIKKAIDLGYNAVHINPFCHTGKSGSIYSSDDYFSYDSDSFEPGINTCEEQEKAVIEVTDFCHENGIIPIFDLVINHTSIDHPYVMMHPEFYLHDMDGNFVHPGADGVEWLDLYKLDYECSGKELWERVLNYTVYTVKQLGFRGFRCDCAAQVFTDFWKYLISGCRKECGNDIIFLAESFNVSIHIMQLLLSAGFNSLYNSSFWWDFDPKRSGWLLEQYNGIQKYIEDNRLDADTISLAGNHDTERLYKLYNGDISKILQIMRFTCFFSGSWTMTAGDEVGVTDKYHVVLTRKYESSMSNHDFSSDIRTMIAEKRSHPALMHESELDIFCNSDELLVITKKYRIYTTKIAINKTPYTIEYDDINLGKYEVKIIY